MKGWYKWYDYKGQSSYNGRLSDFSFYMYIDSQISVHRKFKKKSIDNLEMQKKYISMKNFQFFIYLLYAKSKSTWNKILIKKSVYTK